MHAPKYIINYIIKTKEMVKFRGVSKNDMTPYLQTAVQISCDLCVTQQKGTTNVKKQNKTKTKNPTELLYIQNKVSYV